MLDIVFVGGTIQLARRPPVGLAPGRFARVRDVLATLFFAYIAVGAISLPWHRSWGVTEREWAAALPGDRSPRTPHVEIMHGVSVDAPPAAVWPWLV